VFFRPIRIGDRDVVDGGFSEVCPLDSRGTRRKRDRVRESDGADSQ
jgi:hypothetical protein